jgi:hypothetical protein
MNYIKHLTGFFNRVILDEKLNPTHISLYIALFQYWNVNRFQNPISISRSEIMRISKISAKGTYHKCMKDLHDLGYVKYQPSYNPFKGSLVFLTPFDNFQAVSNRRQVLNKSKTGDGQALVPYTNSSNLLNNQNERAIPNEIEVNEFFKQNKYPLSESKKFFNHYKAIGWKIQGKTPITDWQALAKKWMTNAKSWQTGSSDSADTELGQGSDPEQEIIRIRDLLRSGKKAFHLITPAHFEHLKLNISQEHFKKAHAERIVQVAGTNQYSLNQLWQAYLSGNPENKMVIQDKPNLECLAKRFSVLNYLLQN